MLDASGASGASGASINVVRHNQVVHTVGTLTEILTKDLLIILPLCTNFGAAVLGDLVQRKKLNLNDVFVKLFRHLTTQTIISVRMLQF